MDAETEVLFTENPELSKVPSFKSGVGCGIYLRTSPAVRNSVLISAYLDAVDNFPVLF